MIRRLFWIVFGAGLGLWGRQRALDTVDQRIPKPVQRAVRKVVLDRLRRFSNDVKDLERKRALEHELAELEARRT